MINKTAKELEQLARDNWSNPDQLVKILSEVTYRKRQRAIKLSQHLVERLCALSEDCFLWPTTEIMESYNEHTDSDRYVNTASILSALGYRAGNKGHEDIMRRQILSDIYNREIPNIISEEYMRECGKPKSGLRLKKIANTIAARTKDAKRSKKDYSLAIKHWESDLRYIKREFYNNRYNFKWPIT